MLTPDKDLIAKFSRIVGEKYAITDPDVQAAYLHEQRERWPGHSPLVLRPDGPSGPPPRQLRCPRCAACTLQIVGRLPRPPP